MSKNSFPVQRSVLLFIFIAIIGIIAVYFLNFQRKNRGVSDFQLEKQRQRIFSIMQTKLSETALPSKTLPLISYVLPNATCYYFAGASVANFFEKNIDFDKFLWYGRPLRFKFDQRLETLRTGPPAGDLIMEAFYNLGYKTYQGNTSGILMPAILMTHMTADDNFIFFKKQSEAFDFIKRLVSADQPVILNGAPMQNLDKGDYGFFAGYDNYFVYVRPIPDRHPFYYQNPEILTTFYQIPIKEFLEIWNRTDNTFYWFEKTHERISDQEIYQINKTDVRETYSNMQKFIANLPKDPQMRSYSSNGDGINSRAAASRYLRKLGYPKLADKYMEIAKLYNDKAEFSKIADLEKEAALLWK